MKRDKEKEFICKQCNQFLDSKELVNGKCPHCKNDEDLFINEQSDIEL